MEKYSVLMSVYKNDVAGPLRQSIESMLGQTVPCEQFVIIQDGPLGEDLSGIIAEYAAVHSGLFTVIPLTENVGLGQALDIGLAQCRNELVARMDADDISLPQRCEKLLALFRENPDLALAGTNVDEFYDEPNHVVTTRRVPSDHESIRKFMRRRTAFNHPTVMFRKSEVLRCGGYAGVRKRQDFDLFSRMLNMGCQARNIDESLLLFRSNEGNYKRRKSWSYCKGYIDTQFRNYKRGYCSFWDLTVVTVGQMVMFVAPMGVMKWLSDNFLRSKK